MNEKEEKTAKIIGGAIIFVLLLRTVLMVSALDKHARDYEATISGAAK